TTALIDTGCGRDVIEAVQAKYRIDLVINSHAHPDHSAGNWLLPQARLSVPQEGAASAGRRPLLADRFAEPGPLAKSWQEFATTLMGFQDRPPTEVFADGHVFDFGQIQLRAVHTPGHTSDHYCLFESRQGLLLSFDIELTPYGPWYGHRESDIGQFRASLDLIRDLDPRLVAPSHQGPISRDIRAKLDRYEAVFERRQAKILNLIRKGATLEELVKISPIYGSYPFAPDLLGYWEGMMIEKHLAELEAQGLVRGEGQVYWPL
ncbi:MAG: MBL fold metallo-hydrolase, partial [Deltaproteobacteria bacterium]|nr:MBL fold metallo-hydrolase [Deltaproteobacteria bacterium]